MSSYLSAALICIWVLLSAGRTWQIEQTVIFLIFVFGGLTLAANMPGQKLKRKSMDVHQYDIDRVDYMVDYWPDEHVCADGEVLPIVDDPGPHIVMPVCIIESLRDER